MGRVTSTPPPTRMVAVLKSAPTLSDNNTATHMMVAVLFGRVALHTPKTQQKPFSRRLPPVFDRFSDRRDSGIARRIRHSPVFPPPCAVKKRGNRRKRSPFRFGPNSSCSSRHFQRRSPERARGPSLRSGRQKLPLRHALRHDGLDDRGVERFV